MTDLLAAITRHGYLLIFIVVFAESIGLPLPAALALVGGGAACASHSLNSATVLLLAISAMMIGDICTFTLGREAGWALLGFLCRLSMNPENCILRSAESFYKRGKITLLFAKFVPGINTMAPPLAGSMKMRPWQFLRFDLLGTTLYISAYFTLGYIFHDFLAAITRGINTASHIMGVILLMAVVLFFAYRIWIWEKAKKNPVPRVAIEELALRLQAESDDVIVADVRSHGYYDASAQRIRGSIRFEPNNFAEEIKMLPKDKDIYLYCT
ncbi:MAG TPA: VTT domain-containing protein [Terriglobales bacterium]